jgi:hypothetical protein
MCALTANRKTFAVPQPAVAAKIHEPFDVHRDFTPLVALDLIVSVDEFADPQHFVVGKLVDPAIVGDIQLAADFGGFAGPDAIDIS